jgi:hypothetical protein
MDVQCGGRVYVLNGFWQHSVSKPCALMLYSRRIILADPLFVCLRLCVESSDLFTVMCFKLARDVRLGLFQVGARCEARSVSSWREMWGWVCFKLARDVRLGLFQVGARCEAGSASQGCGRWSAAVDSVSRNSLSEPMFLLRFRFLISPLMESRMSVQ